MSKFCLFRLRRFLKIVWLTVQVCLWVPAQAQTNSANDEATFMARPAVARGLNAIGRTRWVLDPLPDATDDNLRFACWNAANQAKEDEELHRIDLCLSAAAQAFSPSMTYRRERPVLGKPGLAGVGLMLQAEPGKAARVVDGVATTGRSPIHTMPAYAQALPEALYLQVRSIPEPEAQNALVLNHVQGLIRQQMVGMPPPKLVVLDLRGNKGGGAQALVNLSTLFVQNPVSTFWNWGRNGLYPTSPSSTADEAVHAWLAKRALLVLVDPETSSGAEWLVETLRRHAQAVVAGGATPGTLGTKDAYAIDDNSWLQWPSGFILAEGGGIAEGHGVQPDVTLSPEQQADRQMGLVPAWLEGWLRTDWPLARSAAASRRSAKAPVWPIQRTVAGVHPLCLGATQTIVPAKWVASLGTLEGAIWETNHWRLDVHPESEGIHHGLSKPLPAAHDSPMKALIHMGDDRHGAEWQQDGLHYTLSLDLTATKMGRQRNGILVAYKRQLATINRLEPEVMPSEPAICLGHVWMPLAPTHSAFGWEAELRTQKALHVILWHMRGSHGSATADAEFPAMNEARGQDRIEDALNARIGCDSTQAPKVDVYTDGSSEWLMTRQRGITMPGHQTCDAGGAALLSPHYPAIGGWRLTSRFIMSGPPDRDTEVEADFQAWRHMLRNVRVAPLQKSSPADANAIIPR